MYDKEALLAEGDMRTVAEYLGAPVIKRGASLFTECPGHIINKGEREHKLSHFQISKHSGYCYACGYRANPITFAMDYSNNILENSTTEDEACGIVADTLGGRDMYLLSEEKKSTKSGCMMPLSRDDARVIGLTSKNGFRITKEVSEICDKVDSWEKDGYYDDDDNFVYEYHRTEFVPCSLQMLWQEDREAWKSLVRGKALEAYEKYSDFQSVFKNSKSTGGILMANYYLEQATRAMQVAMRFGYKKRG